MSDVTLLGFFQLDDPIECSRCGGPYALRDWRVVSDQIMFCPMCHKLHLIAEVVEKQVREA
jgi:hypothetical protein